MATSKLSSKLPFSKQSAMVGEHMLTQVGRGYSVQASHCTAVDDANRAQIKCEGCNKQYGEKYCGRCRLILCEDCWAGFALHRDRDPSHPVVTYREHILFKEVVNPEWTDEQRQQQLKEDMLTLWFSVGGGDKGELQLEEFPQFDHLVKDHQQKYRRESSCYAQLVSFIGNSGAGKSTLIRVLMQRPWDVGCLGATEKLSVCLPVAGRRGKTLPTSGDVHLYAAPHIDSATAWRLLLYADCEGFGGGSQLPAALKAKQSVLAELSEAIKNKTADSVSVVEELFPRLLYNFSDVVVHAITCESSRMIENDMVKLLEWAQNSQKTAVNRVILPHLIVVLSFSPDELSDWDPEKTTAVILDDHLPALESNNVVKRYRQMLNQLSSTAITTLGGLLERCYSSVTFIRVPDAKNQHLFSKQLQSLDSLIRDAAGKAESTKTEAGYLLRSEIQRKMFTMAFDHYKDNLEKPFDFLESLFSIYPLDDSLSATFFSLLRLAMLAYQSAATEASGREFCSTVTPILCSVIALDSCRSNEKYLGRLSGIFRGKTINIQCVGGGDSVTATYQSQVAKAIHDFFDRACPCDFICKDGKKCVNFRLAHDRVYEHQDSTGEIISFGTFQSAFVDELLLCWNDEIEKSLRELDDLQGKSHALVRPGEQSNGELMVTWSAHRMNLQKLYSAIPKLDVRKIETCSWCFRGKQPRSLECGHRICWGCIELVGVPLTGSNDGTVFAIRSCDHHRGALDFERLNYFTKVCDTVMVHQRHLEK
ncbi:hypothetical protein F5884DRAFT_856673 [Xylogone sp. PMI_703]|nr:hypothetical protein F5884DRAFT_856673 [Xylogone sp. PMI_703]